MKGGCTIELEVLYFEQDQEELYIFTLVCFVVRVKLPFYIIETSTGCYWTEHILLPIVLFNMKVFAW